MQRGMGFGLLAAALGGCEPIAPSGRPFEPVSAPTRAVPPPTAPSPEAPARPAAGSGEADPFVDDRGDVPVDAPTALDRDGTIRELSDLSAPGSDPARSQAQAPVSAPMPVWDPAMPLPDVSFGVQLTAVIPDRFPPRAVLALPDGREVVVTPGTMLAEHGIVVLAIGQNGVRVAHVTPSGFQARVVTETISVLSPAETPPD